MKLTRLFVSIFTITLLVFSSSPVFSASLSNGVANQHYSRLAVAKKMIKKVIKKKVVKKKVIKKKVKKIVKPKQKQPKPLVPESSNGTTTPAAEVPKAQYTVLIENFAFAPATLTIKKGESVEFIQKDAIPHTVTTDPHPLHTQLPGFESSLLSQGQSYIYTFDKAGTWTYHCHPHPTMQGTIVVTE